MTTLPISARLLLSYLLVAVLPLAGLAALYVAAFETALRDTVLGNIVTIADKKVGEIESHMTERRADIDLLSRLNSIRNGIGTLSASFRADDLQNPAYRATVRTLHEVLTAASAVEGYHDLLLMDTAGNVIFSLQKEADLGTNLRSGPYRETRLAQCFERVMKTRQAQLSGFEPYPPSGDQPAAFLVAPVFRDGAALGAVALQLDIRKLEAVAADRTGLGRTGETMLAQKEDGDAMFTMPLRHVENAAYRYRVPLAEVAPAMRDALAGTQGHGVVRDYAGIENVAAWRYLPALEWGMVVKIDTAEALAPAARLRRLSYLALAAFLLLSGSMAFFLGRGLSRPIQRLTAVADRIAAGDLSQRAPPRRDELGRLATAFNRMTDALAQARRNLESKVEARSRELRAVSSLQSAILDQAGALIVVLDREGRVRRFNRACEELTQYAFDEIEGEPVWDRLLAPEEREAVYQNVFAGLKKEPAPRRSTHTNHWVARDGTRRLIEWSNALLLDERGEMEFMVSVGIDITEKEAAAAAIRESEKRLNEAQRIAQVGSWELDLASGKLTWSDETYRLFEIDKAAFAASYDAFLAAVHPDDRERVAQVYAASLKTHLPYEITHRLRMPDDRIKWVYERCGTHYDDHGNALVSTGTVQDITQRKSAEAQISRLAYHDALTGLLNRFSLQHQLDRTLAMAHRDGRALAVMFIDLDRFKTINDTMGHPAGDTLLKEAAARLQDNLRESDVVARLGGDEFVVVLTEVDDAPAAARVAEKLRHALAERYQVGKNELRSTASIGIAFYPNDGADGATLMKNADIAMYHAKSQGRNNVQFFTDEMNQTAMRRLMLDQDLRVAVETQQFELHYQPQLDSRSGRAVGVEALVRWRHPHEGLVLPEVFIPVAEETGLILPLGAWVLDEACRQLRAWRDAGLSGVTMAVNLSAYQLHSRVLHDQVAQTLDKHGLVGADLELEITESVAMHDPDASINQLQTLRDLGVRLSIDDFGTGYSSLSHLKLLPLHTLKLDQSFVRDIEVDVNDVAICTATIALAHSLGLAVVAEGVETEAQRLVLTSHHCDYMQGFLFSKPLPAAAALAYMKENLAREAGLLC